MLNEPVLVDTGPILALYTHKDPLHQVCCDLFESVPFGKAYTCWPVLTEAMYMLRKRAGQRDDLVQAVLTGDLTLLSMGEADLASVGDIFAKYHDQQVDLADACLLHLADREGIDTVFTIDRRHFEMFRKHDGDALRIVPQVA